MIFLTKQCSHSNLFIRLLFYFIMDDVAATAEFLDSLSFTHRIIYLSMLLTSLERSIIEMILVEIVLIVVAVSKVLALEALEN